MILLFAGFLVALNAVIPFLCYLGLGYGARASGAVDGAFLDKLTKVTFTFLFPFLSFNNIYAAGWDDMPSLRVLVFTPAAILLLEGVLLAVVPRLVPENPKRGVIIQAVYRSNAVLFALPLIESVCGPGAAASAAMLVAVVVTVYNATSVVILELFNDREGKITAGDLLSRMVKNPLLQGCAVGLVFFLLRLRLPECLAKPVASFASMTTPLAMFALGGTLQFRAIARNLRYLVPTLAAKLVVVPLAAVACAWAIGLRGGELFSVVAIFATPAAAASYPMAVSMGGDGELAGQCVFVGTVVSLATLFVWIFCMEGLGLLA